MRPPSQLQYVTCEKKKETRLGFFMKSKKERESERKKAKFLCRPLFFSLEKKKLPNYLFGGADDGDAAHPFPPLAQLLPFAEGRRGLGLAHSVVYSISGIPSFPLEERAARIFFG